MDEVTNTNVVAFPEEVIVEVFGVDEHGDIAIVSYQCARVDGEDGIVHPKGEIAHAHKVPVDTTLSDIGLSRPPTDGDPTADS